MKNVNEKTIEQALRKGAKTRGGVALKFVSPGYSGVPDRIILMPGGRCWFVELKSPGKKPDPLQRLCHRLFARLGFPVWVVDSEKSLEVFLAELDK